MGRGHFSVLGFEEGMVGTQPGKKAPRPRTANEDIAGEEGHEVADGADGGEGAVAKARVPPQVRVGGGRS